MFSSLRSRLLLSYVVVICVCLVLVTVTLILIARPVQERLLTARLSTQILLLAPRVRALLERGQVPAQLPDTLARGVARQGMRLLLVDQRGWILGDTAGQWAGQRVPGELLQPGNEERARGRASGPDGSSLMYAAAPVGKTESGEHIWVVVVAPPPQPVTGLFGDLGEGLLMAGGVALVLSILLALLISRSVANPMRKMARAAEAIAAGDYDHQLDISQPEEVRTLARSLEAMSLQVQTSQQAMRDFVINVSHDLKTPLTSVQGFAQALVEGVAGDEVARRHAAEVIYEEASRMVRMVEQLGDLARIDAGEMELTPSLVDLAALVGGVVQTMAPVAADKRVNLATDLPALPSVMADGDRLIQVFTNLIGNALKFTPEGGRVQVEAQLAATCKPSRGTHLNSADDRLSDASVAGDGWIKVSVSDTGCGIPAEDLPRVFERFYQVDKSRASGRGSGLGLAIAKEIVVAHGGRIGVESVEGVGTRFTVEIPLRGMLSPG
jgi:signal transduction histidine kinase